MKKLAFTLPCLLVTLNAFADVIIKPKYESPWATIIVVALLVTATVAVGLYTYRRKKN